MPAPINEKLSLSPSISIQLLLGHIIMTLIKIIGQFDDIHDMGNTSENHSRNVC